MTIYLEDTFESGNTGSWDTSGTNGATISVINGAALFGSYGLQYGNMIDTLYEAYLSKTVNYPVLNIRAYFQFNQHMADNTSVSALLWMAIFGNFSVDLVRGVGNSSYYWRLINRDTATYTGSSFTLPIGSKFCLETHGKIGTSTGEAILYYNDIAVINQTNIQVVDDGFNWTEVRVEAFQDVGNANIGNLYIDNIVIANAYIGLVSSSQAVTYTDGLIYINYNS